MELCSKCNATLDGNAMLDNTLCEPCGIEYWDELEWSLENTDV